MLTLLKFNVLISALLGLMHLLLFNISLPLKFVSIFNVVCSILYFYKQSGRFSSFNTVMLVIVISFFLVQALVGVDNDIKRVIVDFLALIIPLLFFSCLSAVDLTKYMKDDGGKVLVEVSLFILVSSILVMIMMFTLKNFVGLSFNLTFGTPLVALALSVFVFNKKYFYSVVALLVILASGKRSIMLFSILCAVMTYLVSLVISRNYSKALISVVSSSFFVSVFLIVIVSNWQSILEINPKLVKIEYLLSSDTDMYQKSTGRTDEIEQAIEMIDFDNPSEMIFGLGLGTEYNIRFDKYDIEKEKNNIHFSPLNIYIKYGVLFLVLFYFYLFIVAFVGFKSYCIPLSIYCFFYVFFYGMTNFGIVVDYPFWIVLAIVFSHGRKRI